ncbi:MAG: tetratricopeptide repeat protein, partial [Rubricella sp.]
RTMPADRTGISLMEAAGLDPQAAIDALELFAGQELLPEDRQELYTRTHPVSQARIDAIAAAIGGAGEAEPVEPDLAAAYGLLRAKIDGFTNPPADVLARLPATGGTIEERYARAIALSRLPDPDRAARELDSLIADQPRNPFFHELRGQFLLENGEADAAIPHYRRAVALAPDAPLIMTALARALVSTGTTANRREALGLLQRSRQLDPNHVVTLRVLAQAHAESGEAGLAAVTTAEFHAARGNGEEAARFARRAMGLLPEGSPGWIRANELASE